MHKFAADLELEGRSLQPRAVPTSNEAGVGGSCCFVVKTTEVGVTEIDWLREALGHCQRSGGLVESRDFTRPAADLGALNPLPFPAFCICWFPAVALAALQERNTLAPHP